MKKQPDEVYKICQNCGKLIKWKDRVCPYCGVRYRKPQFAHIRGSLLHPIDSDKNLRSIIRKRPISIILVIFLGIFFLLTILIFSLTSPPFPLMAIIICFPVLIIITFSLIFVNLRKNKKRTISFLISTCILTAILILTVFSVGFSNIASKINFSKVISESDSTTTTIIEQITAAENIRSTQNTTDTTEETETTVEEINKSLPTLKLVVYEGPVIVDSDMCYYRIEAKVTGNPAPVIKFSKDDSNGTWGKNKAQVNLKNGESYDLVVTAVNSAGKIVDHIELTWSK